MIRRNARPGRGSLAGSAALHVAVVVVAWSTSAFRPEPLVFDSYRIELVSPPPAQSAEEPTPAAPVEELVVERPVETPPDEEPVPPPPEETAEPEPVREPEPTPDPPSPDPPRPEPAEPEPTPSAAPEAEPSETSGENINVRMEGLRKDYPEYYNNIVRQIQRCFRPPQGGNWETVVYFVINKDGSVSDTRFVKQSGNPRFDFEALGAIADCAGRAGRFGPLPEDLPFDRLPIQFSFRPSGADR